MTEDWHPYIQTMGDSDSPPLLLTCEHATYNLPPECVGQGFESQWLREHHGWDPGAAGLLIDLASVLGVPTVRTNFTRLYIDANRPPDHPGLIRCRIDGQEYSCNMDLSEDEKRERLAVHEAYHNAVAESCAAFQRRHNRFMLIGIHSFTPVLGACDRRHLDVGILHDEHNEDWAQELSDGIRRNGLSCVLNEPYSGMDGLVYAAARHGRKYGIPYLVIEVRNDLIAPDSIDRVRVRRSLIAAIKPLFDKLSELP
ncbi:MAG: N-formylglutamate amidohydrolase [Planctomycetota bacterium]|nr:N-formylglutamate amidohydrolase [Planctomycetota bacterium]